MKFGGSKLEKTLFGFFYIFYSDHIPKFTKFYGHFCEAKQGAQLASSEEKLGQHRFLEGQIITTVGHRKIDHLELVACIE